MGKGVKTWDERFMDLAFQARSWVKGPDTGVGACIVSPDKRLFTLGYSGPPRGIEDTAERLTCPEEKDLCVVHAELNAILNAACSVQGWTIYATRAPCHMCALAIIQAGITRVVSPSPDRGESRWAHSQRVAVSHFTEAQLSIKWTDDPV